jgi:RimJ/RimL family protein N-acetyltransferase
MTDKARAEEKVEISRVGENSIHELIELCRVNFPDSLWWFGPVAGRSWWMRSAYMNEITLRERVLFGLRYFGLILHPGLVLPSVRKLMKKTEKREYITWQDKIAPERVVWGDLHAISPEYRRAGFAKQFMHFVKQRTLELKKDAFLGNVEPDNIKIIKLVESLGYRKMGQTASGLVYGQIFQKDPGGAQGA